MAEEKKVDRRVRKTKKQLKYALVTLLKEKPIQKITVNEITELIDINRGTFYLHYPDVYALLEEVEGDVLKDLSDLIGQAKEKLNSSSDPSVLHHSFEELFIYFLTYIQKNSDMVIGLFGPYGDHSFNTKIQNLIREHLIDDHIADRYHLKEKEVEYIFTYIAAGIVEVVRLWINTGMQETPEQLTALIESINTDRLSAIIEKANQK